MSLIQNKKASFNYEILDKFEAGIELLGTEVKSLRKGQGKIESAHVVVRGGEVFLLGAEIPPFQKNNVSSDYEPTRTRRLLLTKKEIEKLLKEGEKKGSTIVPLSIYAKGSKIKIEVAIVRGKKKFDKRENIKKRESDREMGREMKRSN